MISDLYIRVENMTQKIGFKFKTLASNEKLSQIFVCKNHLLASNSLVVVHSDIEPKFYLKKLAMNRETSQCVLARKINA
jgi:hypothetical protein